MGRKPNPLIVEYFVRGPKLNDHSNRYPHTCKQCGENFPKGRLDSLTSHITKKCPAITDSDRMRVCLELHGLKHQSALAAQERQDARQSSIPAAAINSLPQGWSALETLAEASRQVDLNEHNRLQKPQDDGVDVTFNSVVETSVQEESLAVSNSPVADAMNFELSEQFTLDNPPVSYEQRGQAETQKDIAKPTELTPEERLQALIPTATSSSPSEPDNISVALAATARLNSQLLDPQLVSAEPIEEVPAQPPQASTPSVPVEKRAPQAWGEMTYLTNTAPLLNFSNSTSSQPAHSRGGVRMDTSDGLLNGRPRNARARFTPARRKEVQEVRKIGACIRCRILRKNCGKGTPCDTCRKVLSPRVWKTGCVRSRLHEQLDLYSAGVQVVLSQNRINHMKDTLPLIEDGTVVAVSHFPETGHSTTFKSLVAPSEAVLSEGEEPSTKGNRNQTMMLSQDSEDIPAKVEAYVKEVFPLFVEKEPSKFVRLTLEAATMQLSQGEDDLLNKALELWGLVESIDRERQWTILETPHTSQDGEQGPDPQWIKEPLKAVVQDVYGMICMQLNAAAERKANNTSRNLLNQMDRLLTDSKVKVGFKVFLTAIIFLNCVEKSTWAFMAWEQDHLRPGWPLERDPSIFTQQGGSLAALLRMLLAIRKALPQTGKSADGKIITTDQDSDIIDYFQAIDLDYEVVASRHKGSQFNPADSRSLELMYCSYLLLPQVL